MRKQLLLSTGTICLMLASGYALAQAPGEKRDEPKRTEQPAKTPQGAASQRQERPQESTKAQESPKQESAKGAQERAQGQAREERTKGVAREQKGPSGPQGAEDKSRPSPSAERDRPAKQKEQAQESRPGSREAESVKQRERPKADVETGEKSGAQKSTAESDKSKAGTEATKSGRQGTTQNERDQRGEPSRGSAEQQGAPQQDKRPATATETTRQPAGTDAQNVPSGTSTSQTQINQQARISPDKQVRISETISRQRLAAPERNLNISIRVGEQIPRRVRLHRLPPEIVSIEPAYRGYDYFATEEDIVIVEPRTHRIVSQIPRDPSRARAELRGGGATAAATTGGGGAPCRIMRRDASGNLAEVSPTTVGSTARQDSIAVTVQMPDGGSSQPIALGAPAGDIVVATQGQGDCTITIEPQTR
ncbi:MAG: DUF1236 domain-containing protein [Bradyrhizobium sp.]|uniref:DUF1236 domain-containing protein n=1 Tax=Bradyrhizobium sp. TaxID=376 RepID=UPI0025BE9094|nr:DUF1236 domain-containing protein [Bradyrhizobium sp.]MBI5260269.1 DUF1236 domain-containing protein [Bradyrhizobium sp.]